jgi:hypothetical protein
VDLDCALYTAVVPLLKVGIATADVGDDDGVLSRKRREQVFDVMDVALLRRF